MPLLVVYISPSLTRRRTTLVAFTRTGTARAHRAFSGSMKVRYGARGSYVTRAVADGVACNNAVFGDPPLKTGGTCLAQFSFLAQTFLAQTFLAQMLLARM